MNEEDYKIYFGRYLIPYLNLLFYHRRTKDVMKKPSENLGDVKRKFAILWNNFTLLTYSYVSSDLINKFITGESSIEKIISSL